MPRLVIARARVTLISGAPLKGNIIAIEQAGYREDWPPSPQQIVRRWKAQGVIEDESQVEVWEEQIGYYYTRMGHIPTDDESYSREDDEPPVGVDPA